MSINTIAAAIASICNGTSIVVSSVTLTVNGIDPPPAQLSTAKLPCAYVLTGDAAQAWGSDWGVETRNYRIQCAVETVEQATRETRELQIRALIVALRDKLAGYPRLSTDGVLMATVISDTGPLAIADTPNNEYVGFEMIVSVQEHLSRTYAANE
jgi:hypothetical protein